MNDYIVPQKDSATSPSSSEFNQNSLAPSEKHLEDWIIDNPHLLCEQICEPDEYTDGIWHFIHRIVNRQVRLPSGRADIIAVVNQNADLCVAPIEIKKGVIDFDTVGQCMRYMRDLREIFLRTKHPGITSEIWMDVEYKPYGIADQLLGYSPEVTGMVIGHEVKDKNLLIACQTANIDVVTYQYIDGAYVFESHIDEYALERSEHYTNYAYGAIGDAFREIMSERHIAAKRHRHVDGEAS